jgi:aminoglycoside phosphotransferase (APT) family kinase protein
LAGGQLNTAIRVNGEYVLRCREAARATGSLQREAAVLARVGQRLPTPEVLVCGLDDLLGEYLIQRWVPGKNMLRAWLDNPDVATREYWLSQWLEAVRVLHEERFARPAELPRGDVKEYPTWRNYMESRLRRRLDFLMRAPGMDRELVLTTERYVRRNAAVLEDAPFVLVHRDLHFGNALVDGPRLTALLDFELTEIGALDYELDTLYRFLRDPAQFAEPALAPRVTPTRFASVWVRLKRGYPELFATPRLRERLCLYALDYSLSCLVQAHTGRWGGGETVEPALARIAEILRGTYGPE